MLDLGPGGQVMFGTVWLVGFGDILLYILEKSFCVAHPALELMILLPQPLKCGMWCELLCLAF